MTVAQRIARWRVALGFAFGLLVAWLAAPTWRSLAAGALVAVAGEALRVWAAGHVEKSREVTRSGPYRFTRHPLYLGSSVIALGIAVACASWAVAGLVGVYVAVTLSAAIRAEEAHLRAKFGGEYDAYASRAAPPMHPVVQRRAGAGQPRAPHLGRPGRRPGAACAQGPAFATMRVCRRRREPGG